MANRYWVGGDGVWTPLNTLNWSTISGGPGGASVPTDIDDVYFDENSDIGEPFTVTVDRVGTLYGITCKNFSVYPAQKATFISRSRPGAETLIEFVISGNIDISGNQTFVDMRNFKLYLYVYPSSSSVNINTNGIECNVSSLSIGPTTATVNLLSNLNILYSDFFLRGSSSVFNTNGYSITCYYFSLNAGTTNLSTSNIYSNALDINGTVINNNAHFYLDNIGYGAYQEYIAINSGITITNLHFRPTVPDVDQSASWYINTALTVTNFYAHAPPFNGATSVEIKSNTTIQNLIIVDTSPNRRVWITGASYPSVNVTVNSITNLSDVDFTGITFVGAATPLTGTRLRNIINQFYINGDRAGGVTISSNSPKTVYWNKPEGGNFYDLAWASTSGGVPSASNFPMPEDTIVFDDIGLLPTSIVEIHNNYYHQNDWNFPVANFDCSTRTIPIKFDFAFYELHVSNSLNFPENNSIVSFSPISYICFIFTDIKTFTINGSINSTDLSIYTYKYAIGAITFADLSQATIEINQDISIYSIDCQTNFNANNHNVTTDKGSYFNVTPNFGTGTWKFSNLTVNTQISENYNTSIDYFKNANFIVTGKYVQFNTTFDYGVLSPMNIIGIQFDSNVTSRVLAPYKFQINSLHIDYTPLTAETITFELRSIVPRNLSVNPTISHPYRIEFKLSNASDNYLIESMDIAANQIITIGANPSIKLDYIGNGCVILNNIIINRVNVTPLFTWYAKNSIVNNSINWGLASTAPLITTSSLIAGASDVSIAGENLSQGDGAVILQNSKKINLTNYVSGSSPTVSIPSMNDLFSNGIKFGTAQLAIMENI